MAAAFSLLIFFCFFSFISLSFYSGSPTGASAVHPVGRAEAMVRFMSQSGICEHHLPNAIICASL